MSIMKFISELDTSQLFMFFFLFFLSSIYIWKNVHINFPPGPFPWPIFGNPMIFQGRHHIRLTNLKTKYGDIFSLQAGKQKVVVVCSLDGITNGLKLSDIIFDGRPNLPSSDWLFHGCRQRGKCIV